MESDLVNIFKVLADANRLKILGLLSRQEYSGEELAAFLALKPSTVSHHLSKLAAVGLVSARAEGYYNMYQLERTAVERIRHLFSQADLGNAADDIHADAYERKVISDFTLPDGSLKQIPAQRKKLEIILDHIVQSFELGLHYTEQQVNEVLARFHPDTASLRRELVASRLMARQGGGGEYWRL